jgi:hypothetical protein
MAITSTGYQTPATERVGLVKDIYDKITQYGWDETPILNKIGRQNVTGIDHSWIIDPLITPTRSPKLEISDFTGADKSTKQLRSNSVEIFIDEVMVSRTMQAVKTYGGKELEYELSKRVKSHKKRLEQMILGIGRNASAKVSVFLAPITRTDTVAGEAAGLFYFLAKGATAFTTGTTEGRRGNIIAFDEDMDWTGDNQELTWERFNQILQNVYDGGATPKDIYVGSNLKARINDFVTRQLTNEKKTVQTITSIETDFGTVNILMSRFLADQFGLGDVLIAGDFEYVKDGLLIPTELNDVPTSKTAKQKRIYTEATLVVRNADALAIGVGLK